MPLSSAPAWLWLVFAGIVVGGVSADWLLFHSELTLRRAALRTAGWIAIGLGFAGLVGAGLGREAAAEYLSAFLLEKALSLDNLAMFLVIFRELGVSSGLQHRVLTVGIGGAVVARGAVIAAGMELLRRWHPLVYVLAGLLVIAAARTAFTDDRVPHPRLLRLIRRMRVVSHDANGRFFTRVHGRWFATTLVAAVIAIEVADIAFALDSISSAFAVTTRPFVLYSSNLFALLGLRALFALIAGALSGVRFMNYGIAVLLLLAAGKLALSTWITVPPLTTAGGVLALLAALWTGGFIHNRRRHRS